MTKESRESKQKREERRLCLPVATAINESEATDYYVPDVEYQLRNCVQASDVDIVMLSSSGAYPPYRVQVTTIPRVTEPSDRLLRDDNDSEAKLEQDLTKALRKRDLTGCQIWINLTEAGVLRGLRPVLVGQVADLIQRKRRDRRGSWRVDEIEISALSKGLTGLVSDMSGHDLSSASVSVNAGSGCWIPEDRCFIDEAIRQKAGHLGTSKGRSNLALVIGASSAIVQKQIDTWLSKCSSLEIPFAEVWIVPVGGPPIALKQSRRV